MPFAETAREGSKAVKVQATDETSRPKPKGQNLLPCPLTILVVHVLRVHGCCKQIDMGWGCKSQENRYEDTVDQVEMQKEDGRA